MEGKLGGQVVGGKQRGLGRLSRDWPSRIFRVIRIIIYQHLQLRQVGCAAQYPRLFVNVSNIRLQRLFIVVNMDSIGAVPTSWILVVNRSVVNTGLEGGVVVGKGSS